MRRKVRLVEPDSESLRPKQTLDHEMQTLARGEAPGDAVAIGVTSGANNRSWNRLVLTTLAGLGLVLCWQVRLVLSGENLRVGQVGELVESFASIFLGIFIEAVPFLLLGVLASALIQIFVSDSLLARLLPRQPVLAAFAGASLGMIFPVCDCGVIPVSRRLLSKGAPVPTAISFMLAGPVINPVVLASTWIAFGSHPSLALGRFALVLAVAVIVGLVFGCHEQPAELLVTHATPAVGHSHDHESHARGGRLFSLLRLASDEFLEMGRYLVVGAFLGATIQTLVPRSALLAIGHDPALSVVTLMSLAVVLSVCSTVDAFVALSFASTFSSGALLAFLTFGPMVDLKSILMYTTTLRRPATLLLVLLCAQLIFIVAAFVNLNFG